jgi:hypothetical protein
MCRDMPRGSDIHYSQLYVGTDERAGTVQIPERRTNDFVPYLPTLRRLERTKRQLGHFVKEPIQAVVMVERFLFKHGGVRPQSPFK